MNKHSRYLAEIGARGGRKSRRTLDPDTARAMVRVREARRAFRRYRDECFATVAADREIGQEDVAWVAEHLIRLGSSEARKVGSRLAGVRASMPAADDTLQEADAVRVAAIRRERPAERLRQVLDLSESMRALSLAGLQRRYPNRSDLELVELLIGYKLSKGARTQ